MRTKLNAIILSFAVLSLILPATATASGNLIKNGGFKLGPQVGSGFATYAKGSTAIPGWTVTMGTVDVIGSVWHDPDGDGRSIDLDGTPGPGGIAQTFATVPGTKYKVAFSLASNPQCGPPVKRLTVTVGNVTKRYTFTSAKASTSAMGWLKISFPFVATGKMSTLTFTSTDPAGSLCGPAIDSVSVTR
jgi:choice-of-anchor C domain-containing protein